MKGSLGLLLALIIAAPGCDREPDELTTGEEESNGVSDGALGQPMIPGERETGAITGELDESLSGERTDEGGVIIELTDPDESLRPAQPPQNLRLTQLWQNQALQAPGNLLVMPSSSGEEPVLAVLDGHRTVVLLDAQGEAREQIELPLPGQAGVTVLRAVARNSESQSLPPSSRYVVGYSKFSPQVHLLDADWKLLFNYPSDELLAEDGSGVQDALLIDCDGSGDDPPILFVGFWGQRGTHAIDISGEFRWSNRTLSPALSLAPGVPNLAGFSKVLVTGDRGPVVSIDRFGQADAPRQIDSTAIHLLFEASLPHSPIPYCGASYDYQGRLSVFGINDQWRAQWQYSLPEGSYAHELRFVTSGQLFPGGGEQWVIAGPEGSIHLITNEGEFIDWFRLGEHITGLAVVPWNGRGVLVVATPSGITAWHVE